MHDLLTKSWTYLFNLFKMIGLALGLVQKDLESDVTTQEDVIDSITILGSTKEFSGLILVRSTL